MNPALLLQKLTVPVTELNSYVRRNPRDPVWLYDLALAESPRQRDLAVQHLREALALDAKMRSARLGSALLRQEGNFDEAINDSKLVLNGEPDKVPAPDLVGNTHLSAGRTKEAIGMMSRASQLAPENSLVLLHYSQVAFCGSAALSLRRSRTMTHSGHVCVLDTSEVRSRRHQGYLTDCAA